MVPWTVGRQALLSMEFPKQEYWSGLPYSSPGDLPHSGIEPRSPALQADSLPPEPQASSCRREDPEINQIQTQNQVKQDDWPKETRKKCPIWALPWVYPFFFQKNTFRLYAETHFYTVDGPRPCHWPLFLVVQ